MVKRVEHHKHSGCPVACTLDIIGDHWTLLVVRGLMFMDLHEYKDFLAMPERISSSILSDRLKKLEGERIIASIPHPDSKRRKLYYLTKKGKGLIYLMLEIARWADRNIADRVVIPDERRPFLDNPPEQVAQMVFLQLEEWEREHLP